MTCDGATDHRGGHKCHCHHVIRTVIGQMVPFHHQKLEAGRHHHQGDEPWSGNDGTGTEHLNCQDKCVKPSRAPAF